MTLSIDWDKVTEKKSGPAEVDMTDAIEVPANVLKQFKSSRGLGRSIAARFPDHPGIVRTVEGKVYLVRKDLNAPQKKNKK